jgi:hypothetical protein
MRRVVLPIALALAVAACADAPGPVPEADVARARDAIAPLQKGLLEALAAALAEGGPEGAIDVCAIRAPDLARQAARPGVEVGRTSHRLRNPANAPRPWVSPVLAAWVDDPAAAAPRALRLEGNRIGYVQPIRTVGLCLACHGTEISPSVLARLAERYPADRATGFREGDLRGAFWVELDPAADAR